MKNETNSTNSAVEHSDKAISAETIILKQTDYEKIAELLNVVGSDATAFLEEELDRATLVDDTRLPADVVAMHSEVHYEDTASGKKSQVVLVYPPEANIEENRISVLTSVGSALIGLRAGQMIQWPLPNGTRKELRVLAVKQAS